MTEISSIADDLLISILNDNILMINLID